MEYILLFVVGAVFGSFLNVVIYRVPLSESIITPPSHCPKCDARLKSFDLIPIFSWLFLRGRCRYCDAHISYRYAFVEVLTGLLFVFTYYQVGFKDTFISYLLLTCLLIADTFIDIEHLILPNELLLFGIISFMFLNLGFSFIPWEQALFGAVTGLVPLLVLVILTGGNGMGIGDVKLMGMVGLFLGWKLALLTLLMSFLFGGFFGVILLVTKMKNSKDPIPFGPWIALAAFVSMYYGQGIITWYIGTM